ncbi:DUF3530 family protein [Thalassotalea marina]|uniref:DUF3530 family protein n=1 Tax=Thalassotalea marina TaxID=1673741 RepID=A0A919BA86_9GAMM|nr:DUF3530 family protein [Thalassotalea marina]GHF78442.1 hypothetical protein GCM10017161_01890 [Thalassotalea marina]
MIKYTFLFSLLLLTNVCLAQEQGQQEENKQQQESTQSTPANVDTNNSADTANKDTAATTSSTNVVIEHPIPQTTLYQSDLKHYLPSDVIEQVMVGPDNHTSIIKPHLSANQKGVMILLPEWQQSAMSPQAVNFLQETLPEQGWVTIAVQPLAKPPNYPSTAISVTEQVEQNKQTIENYQQNLKGLLTAVMEKAQNYPGIIVFVTQGHNAMFVGELLAAKEIPQPQALVLLSAQMSSTNAMEQSAEKLASLQLPVLDLYLRMDSPVAKQHAKIRQKHVYYLAKSQFRQKKLHNIYSGYYQGEPLIKEINGWLKSIGW